MNYFFKKSEKIPTDASFENMKTHKLVAIVYEKLAEQSTLEAEQIHKFRLEIFKISLGWTLFSALILACGWGMNLQRVYDIGLIATIVCILFSCGAFCINGIIHKHLAKKASEYEQKAQNERICVEQERSKLESYATEHRDTKLLQKIQEWNNL